MARMRAAAISAITPIVRSEAHFTETIFKDHVKHGFYLATIGHCIRGQ
jgi:hypothetical protein